MTNRNIDEQKMAFLGEHNRKSEEGTNGNQYLLMMMVRKYFFSLPFCRFHQCRIVIQLFLSHDRSYRCDRFVLRD